MIIKPTIPRDDEMKEVFASYHFTTMDLKFNGFGNYIGRFHMELYVNNMAKFIEDLQKAIAMSLDNSPEFKAAGVKIGGIKVMYFR